MKISATAPSKPQANEYAEYYGRYVSLVPEGDVVETLARQGRETLELLRSIPESRAGHAYEPGKWTIKQLVGHVIDGERIFAYRALAIARGERANLPSMEQDEYMEHARFDERTLESLCEEFDLVRRANVLMMRGFDADAWARRGVASDNEVTVLALAYVIAGHELHHVNVLRAKYL